MKKTTSLVAGSILALTMLAGSVGTASAQNRDFKTALEECFWGLLFPDEDQRGLSLALNVVSGALGSYAFTSATLTPDTFCAAKKAATAKFINEAYPQLAEDVVRGDGEFLTAALDLVECGSLTGRTQVAGDMRSDLAGELALEGYSDLGHREKALRMFQSLEISAATHCTV